MTSGRPRDRARSGGVNVTIREKIMNRILATATGIALCVTLFSAGVPAQAQKPAPVAKAGSTRPASAPAKAAPRATNRRSTWADARVCLEFPTNAQIIKCSEKYRFMKAPA
jgi:hypothetical protein